MAGKKVDLSFSIGQKEKLAVPQLAGRKADLRFSVGWKEKLRGAFLLNGKKVDLSFSIGRKGKLVCVLCWLKGKLA